MGYILFNIGPVQVHGYGLMIGIGIVAAMLLILLRAKGAGLNPDNYRGVCRRQGHVYDSGA